MKGTHHCKQSGKTLISDSSLQLDCIIKLIPTDKPFQWYNECGKALTYANYLCRHERSLTGENSSEYTQCGKNFAYHSYPQRHERIHTGEKPYEGIQYGEAFVHHSSLQMHEPIHTGKKPYKCNQCDKAYS